MAANRSAPFTFRGHRALLLVVDGLEGVLRSKEKVGEGWGHDLARRLEGLEDLLAQHYAWEEASVLFTTFPRRNPSFRPQIENLLREHRSSRREIEHLRTLVAKGGGSDRGEEIEQRLWDLCHLLRRHEAEEEQIVADAHRGGIELSENVEPSAERSAERKKKMLDELDRDPGTLDTDHVPVRTLNPSDLAWVVRIDQRHSGRSRSAYYEVKMREAEADTGVRISLAAEIDGEPVGFLMGRLYYGEFGLPEPVAILDSIGVAEHASGKKVGKALVRQLATNLRALGIENLQTQVEWDQGELLAFFRHLGFAPASRLCLEAKLDALAAY